MKKINRRVNDMGQPLAFSARQSKGLVDVQGGQSRGMFTVRQNKEVKV